MSAEYVNTTSGLIILRRECVIYRFTIKDSFHQNILGKIIFRTVILQKKYIYADWTDTHAWRWRVYFAEGVCIVFVI